MSSNQEKQVTEGSDQVVSPVDSPPEKSPINIEELIQSQDFSDFVKKKGFEGILRLNKELKGSYESLAGSSDKDTKVINSLSGVVSDPSEALTAALSQMQAKLDRLEKEKDIEVKRQKALSLLGSTSLPESLKDRWANRIDPQKDIKSQIQSLDQEWLDIQKQLGLTGAPLPLGGSSKSESADKEEVENIIDKL